MVTLDSLQLFDLRFWMKVYIARLDQHVMTVRDALKELIGIGNHLNIVQIARGSAIDARTASLSIGE